MEFENVGRHCALPNCNQKDFLPFNCDFCTGTFCLEHRTYAAHGCSGQSARDFTSLDCPICSKAVKFTRNQNADEVWEVHYQTDCTRQHIAEVPKVATCSATNCRVVLGASNSFKCPKCSSSVCISHRLPEEHNCRKLCQLSRLQSVSNNVPKQNSNKAEFEKKSAMKSSKTVLQSSVKKKNDSRNDPANSLLGSAHRRKQNLENQSNSDANHIESSSNALSSRKLFVCPNCNVGFDDAIELLSHCEVFHASNGANLSNSSFSNADNNAESNLQNEVIIIYYDSYND
jgi:predicted nucleic acid binding AN1-type Zn finger protein